MKRTLLGLALLTLSSASVAAQVYNGRLTAMSGVGYATGDYVDGVLFNPSLGATQADNDDFALVVNGGGIASDQDDLLDSIESLTTYLDELSNMDYGDFDIGMADELVRRLEDVDGKNAFISASGSGILALPTNHLSVSLVAHTRLDIGVVTDIDQSDYELIDNNISQLLQPRELQSSVIGKGAWISDMGVSLARSLPINDNSELLVGVLPKRTVVETFVYNARVSEFEEDNFDAADYTRKSSAMNFDAGVTYVAGNMRYALSVRDAISREFETITDEVVLVEPLSTAAIGYKNRWLSAEAALDLNAVPSFATRGDSRFARVGVEFNAWRWVQLRAGVQKDLEETLKDTYSFGAGISPFDTVNVDGSVIMESSEISGVAFQLGVRF